MTDTKKTRTGRRSKPIDWVLVRITPETRDMLRRFAAKEQVRTGKACAMGEAIRRLVQEHGR